MSPPGLEADGSDLRPKENPKGEAPQEEAGQRGPPESWCADHRRDRPEARSGPRSRALERHVPSVLVFASPSRPERRHFT